jgi:hypothetical protein
LSTLVLEEHFLDDLQGCLPVEPNPSERSWRRRVTAKLLRPLIREM